MNPRRAASLAILVAALLACASHATAARAQVVTVFAAASLTNVFQEIGRAWQQQTGREVRFSFAASSTLARQIEAGAPADIFASADEQWMNWLAQRSLLVPDSVRTVIGNRLVVVTRGPRNDQPAPAVVPDLPALLGPTGRLATGDPAHVPVGRYARQALTQLNQWTRIEPRLVRADSVRAALILVERGEAPVGIVYATDAAATPNVRVIGTFPETTHDAIAYPMALVARRDSAAAREFLRFLEGEAALAIYRKAGFLIRK